MVIKRDEDGTYQFKTEAQLRKFAELKLAIGNSVKENNNIMDELPLTLDEMNKELSRFGNV